MTHIEIPVDTREEDVERINEFSKMISEILMHNLIPLNISIEQKEYFEKVIEDGLLQYDYPSKRCQCE